MCRLVLLALPVALALPAQASIYVGTNPVRATLGVDAAGTAVVTWVLGGAKQVVSVPAKGQLVHDGSLERRADEADARVRRLRVYRPRRVPRQAGDGHHDDARGPAADSVLVRPEWKGKRYRALVAGPNLGATFAPDAQAITPGS